MGGENTWDFGTDHGILGLSCIFSCIRINLRDKIAMQFIFYKTFDSRLYLVMLFLKTL